MNYLAVFIGGGAGSIARFLISRLLINYSQSWYPLATLVANVLSCLVIAGLIFFIPGKFNNDYTFRILLVTGFCGGFSTFSTFSFETAELIRNGNWWMAGANIMISVVACVAILYYAQMKMEG